MTNLLCDIYSDQRPAEFKSRGGNGLQVYSFTLLLEEAGRHVRFPVGERVGGVSVLGIPSKIT